MGGAFESSEDPASQAYALNAQALAILGIALLIQIMLALWCIIREKSRKILSWNSGHLNTTLALLRKNRIQRIHGTPVGPQPCQFPARKSVRSVFIIVILLWILFPVILIWGHTMWFVELKDENGTPNTSFDPEHTAGGITTSSSYGHSAATLLPLAIITAIQIV